METQGSKRQKIETSGSHKDQAQNGHCTISTILFLVKAVKSQPRFQKVEE